MNFPVGDMLIRIKNASLAGHDSLEVPYSSHGFRLCKFLVDQEYLDGVEKEAEKRLLKVTLRFDNKKPRVSGMKLFSKPGLKRYIKAKDLGKLHFGENLVIISTSKGLMSLKQAKKQKMGGELICEVS